MEKAMSFFPTRDILEYVCTAYIEQFGDVAKAFQIAMRIRALSNDGAFARGVLEEIAWEYG